MSTTTDIFSVPSSVYIRQAFIRFLLGNWWWIATILIIPLSIGVLYDIRFLFIAAILFFLIYPMALFTFFINNVTSPNARAHLRSHRIIFSDNGMTIEYLTDEPEIMVTERFVASFSEITHFSATGTNLIIERDDKSYPFTIVPLSTMTEDDISKTIDLLYASSSTL